MKQEIRRLPDSELELMQIIWAQEPPVTRTDIEGALLGEHPLAEYHAPWIAVAGHRPAVVPGVIFHLVAAGG